MHLNKVALFGLLAFTMLIAILVLNWDGSSLLAKEIKWIFSELPEVKSIELLDSLKKT